MVGSEGMLGMPLILGFEKSSLRAMVLGVRRAGITLAAMAFQGRRLIRYHRGDITVLDRAGLIEAACGCYTADRSIYRRVITEGGAP